MPIKGRVFLAASLDGFIARTDGDISWLHEGHDGSEDHGFDALMNGVDGLLIGRNTYEVVRNFEPWPYAKPVVVLSRALPAGVGHREDVRIWNVEPQEALQRLEAEGWSAVYLDGGQLVQSCLRAGLVHELTITRIPRLLGSGIPLFADLPHELRLSHESTQSWPSGLVQSRYRIVADASAPIE